MNEDQESRLSDAEVERFAKLQHSHPIRSGAEERLMSKLADRGVIVRSRRPWNRPALLAAAAMIAIAFTAGIITDRALMRRSGEATTSQANVASLPSPTDKPSSMPAANDIPASSRQLLWF